MSSKAIPVIIFSILYLFSLRLEYSHFSYIQTILNFPPDILSIYLKVLSYFFLFNFFIYLKIFLFEDFFTDKKHTNNEYIDNNKTNNISNDITKNTIQKFNHINLELNNELMDMYSLFETINNHKYNQKTNPNFIKMNELINEFNSIFFINQSNKSTIIENELITLIKPINMFLKDYLNSLDQLAIKNIKIKQIYFNKIINK